MYHFIIFGFDYFFPMHSSSEQESLSPKFIEDWVDWFLCSASSWTPKLTTSEFAFVNLPIHSDPLHIVLDALDMEVFDSLPFDLFSDAFFSIPYPPSATLHSLKYQTLAIDSSGPEFNPIALRIKHIELLGFPNLFDRCGFRSRFFHSSVHGFNVFNLEANRKAVTLTAFYGCILFVGYAQPRIVTKPKFDKPVF